MTDVCPVCARETANLRKHCTGKWLNDPNDFEHLIAALELHPAAAYHIKAYLQEEKHDRKEDRGSMTVVRGKILN